MNPLLPLFIAISGAVVYNLGAKLVPAGANPLHYLVAVYLLAAAICLLGGFALNSSGLGGTEPLFSALRQSGLALALLSVGIVLIELGYILIYRAGWNVALAPIMVSTGVMLALLPATKILFQQTPSPRALLGAALCLAGLILAAWK